VRICFVCMGNICRSPTAEGVFRHLVEQAGLGHAVTIDSAGTDAWHVGEPPDVRAAAEARRRGVSLDGQRARQFTAQDFARFDRVIAMDGSNLRKLERLAHTPEARAKLSLLRDHDPASAPGQDVPDPYYGGRDGFPRVFDIVTAGCRGLLDEIRGEL